MFYAIATLLEEEFWQTTLDCLPEGVAWAESGKIETKYPHFSWMVGKGIDQPHIAKKLESISLRNTEFSVMNGGFGIFPGEEPVVTLNLARNENLCILQKMIWNECAPFMSEINMHYSPEAWIPHITLLHHGIHSQEYCQFLERLLHREIQLNLIVKNICVLYRSEMEVGQMHKFSFQKV